MSTSTTAMSTTAYTQIASGAYNASLSLVQTWGKVRIKVAASLPAVDAEGSALLWRGNTPMVLTTSVPGTDKIWGLAVDKAVDVTAVYDTAQAATADPRLPDAGAEDDVLVSDGTDWTSAPVPA